MTTLRVRRQLVRFSCSLAPVLYDVLLYVTDCPTCSEFYRMDKMLHELQSLVQQLSVKVTELIF